MAKFSSLNGTSCANVTSVNGTAKASVNNVNGLETCSSGHDPGPSATKLYLGFEGGRAAYADVSWFGGAIADVTEDIGDTEFDLDSLESSAENRVAYGKDGSGNPRLITVSNRDTWSLFRISATDWAASTTNSATRIDTGTDIETEVKVKQREVAWGNDVWVSIGKLKCKSDETDCDVEDRTGKRLYRSTDGGTNWSAVWLDDLTNMPTTETDARGLVTNGTGKWWFGVYDSTTTPVQSMIYCSEDDGQTWALHHTITDAEAYKLAYTNDTLVLTYKYTGGGVNQRRAISAAGSATSGASNWGTSVALAEDGDPANSMIANSHGDIEPNRIAAGNGRVICCDTHNAILLIVDGKTITVSGARTAVAGSGGVISTNIQSVATDGEGNWYIGSRHLSDGGDIARNTNNGDPASWVMVAQYLGKHSGHDGRDDARSMCVDRYLPL